MIRHSLIALLLWASPVLAQTQPELIVSGQAHRLFATDFDTTHVERLFCVWWHESEDNRVFLDSAFVQQADSADSLHVWPHRPCPRMMATAHWHLLDFGADTLRSPIDSVALVKIGNPFGILLIRRAYGLRFPLYSYYDR